MDTAQLGAHWAHLKSVLEGAFPHAQIPDIFPQATLWDGLTDRIAVAHDLTPAEAAEAVEDVIMHALFSYRDTAAA